MWLESLRELELLPSLALISEQNSSWKPESRTEPSAWRRDTSTNDLQSRLAFLECQPRLQGPSGEPASISILSIIGIPMSLWSSIIWHHDHHETAFLIFEAAEGALPSTSRSCCNVSSWCRKHDVDQSSHRGVLMMPLIQKTRFGGTHRQRVAKALAVAPHISTWHLQMLQPENGPQTCIHRN